MTPNTPIEARLFEAESKLRIAKIDFEIAMAREKKKRARSWLFGWFCGLTTAVIIGVIMMP